MMSTPIEILNIPNFYSSYYVLGLYQTGKLSYKPEKEFEKFNNKGYVVFRTGGRVGIIDNHDPIGVNHELYEVCHLYFATNKLLGHPEYEQDKVKPIFPHFPVNILPIYVRLFGINLIFKLKPRDLAREIYVLRSRPKYRDSPQSYHFGNYVFFSGSTWKKEPWANQIRADFIRICKADPRIDFEGGFIPRTDGDNFGYDEEVNRVKYPPKKFTELSSKSLLSLNNPAVLGAVSWRLAEYWMNCSFVVSFPFAIDLPVHPKDREDIHYVSDSQQYSEVVNLIFDNPDYHQKVARGGYRFFKEYCTPQAQVRYMIDGLLS